MCLQAVISFSHISFRSISNLLVYLTCLLVPRVATPFGGCGNAPKTLVKSVEVYVLPSASSLPPSEVVDGPVPLRPSFNRTALGWVTDSAAPLHLASATMEPKSSRLPMFIPESDELWVSFALLMWKIWSFGNYLIEVTYSGYIKLYVRLHQCICFSYFNKKHCG